MFWVSERVIGGVPIDLSTVAEGGGFPLPETLRFHNGLAERAGDSGLFEPLLCHLISGGVLVFIESDRINCCLNVHIPFGDPRCSVAPEVLRITPVQNSNLNGGRVGRVLLELNHGRCFRDYFRSLHHQIPRSTLFTELYLFFRFADALFCAAVLVFPVL